MAPLSPVFDLDLLRTLVCIAEEESFTRAAERVGRTQSAVTLQIQKLEAMVGYPLLARSKGGPVSPTARGRVLLEHARAMLKLNDDALNTVAGDDVAASLRMAVSSSYASLFVQHTVDQMQGAFPNIMVEVTKGKSCQLVPQLKEGAFDLIVVEEPVVPRDWPTIEVWRGPLRWITSATGTAHLFNPLPLSLWVSDCPWRPPWLDECFWRGATLHALKQAGRAYRVVAVADTVEDYIAPVLLGQAVTVCNDPLMPQGVRVVAADEGLPQLPDTRIVVVKSENATQPFTDAIIDLVVANLRAA